MKFQILSVVFMLSAGCDVLDSHSESCFGDAKHLEMFSSELTKRGIRNESSGSENCINVFNLSADESTEIRTSIFGSAPPKHLSIGWPIEAWGEIDGVRFQLNESERVSRRLAQLKIETSFTTYYGRKYLVWSKEDDLKVLKNQL